MVWHTSLDSFLEIWEGGSLHSHGHQQQGTEFSQGNDCKMGKTWENLGRMGEGGFLDELYWLEGAFGEMWLSRWRMTPTRMWALSPVRAGLYAADHKTASHHSFMTTAHLLSFFPYTSFSSSLEMKPQSPTNISPDEYLTSEPYY